MTFPCRCVLIIPPHDDDDDDDDRETAAAFLNMCGGFVSGPDQPMCNQCEASGHANVPEQLPMSDPRRAALFGARYARR